jgi:hypothetical protein
MPLDVAERRRRLDHARRSTSTQDGRTATCATRSTPPNPSPRGGT